MNDLLLSCQGIEDISAATNGCEALEQIQREEPDLLLLDVEMPRLDGFDVVEQLAQAGRDSGEPCPLIIFVTAYPRFAAHAFDTGALDFLTKPVRLSRLETALSRARGALREREAEDRLQELAKQLEALRAEHSRPKDDRLLWVQRRGEMIRVNLDQVDWIKAEGEYVRLHLEQQSYLHRDLLSSIMKQLDPEKFLRVHRSYAVNRDRVASIRRLVHGGWKLLLDSGIDVPVGRTYRRIARTSLLQKEGATAEADAPGISPP